MRIYHFRLHYSGMLIFVMLLFGFKAPYMLATDLSFQLAIKYFAAENYEHAITEYKRFIFFNPQHDLVPEAYYQIGLAFRNQQNWTAAIAAMRQSMATTDTPRLREKCAIAIAIIYLASGNYDAAEFELLRLAHFADDPPIKNKAYYFLGVCYTYKFQWEKARQAFNQFLLNNSNLQSDRLDSLFAGASNLKYKSPKLAKWLSTFIPGAGQIYVGDFRNGFNAFILTSITIYLFIDALVEQRLQDALIGHLFLVERFYRGNRANAQRIAHQHNEKINRTFGKKIIDHVLIIF